MGWWWFFLLLAALVWGLWRTSQPRTKVYVVLQGRLGNQLFQLAAAEAHRRRQGLDTVCAVGSVHTELRAHWPGPLFVAAVVPPHTPTWTEPAFLFGRLPPPHVRCLRGYFQAPAYFEDVLPPTWFTRWLRPAPSSRVAPPAWRARDTTVVGVHVRRGDYVHLATVHPPLEWEYYAAARHELQRRHLRGRRRIATVVFSDDIAYVKRVWGDRFLRWTGTLHWVTTGSDWQQLTWLTQCDHHIIANSTFSWWGAYARAQPGHVVAPVQWFGLNGPDAWHSLYPESWCRLAQPTSEKPTSPSHQHRVSTATDSHRVQPYPL